jgi:type II secretory ATPase GspE/PulE/Tfp pilus assembly ATPase PilB-like protein
LFEFLALDDSWSRVVNEGGQEVELLAEMKRRGIPALLDDGLNKLTLGMTPFEEVRNAVACW